MEPTTEVRLSAHQLIKAAYSKTNGRKDLIWKIIGVVILAMIPLFVAEMVTNILVETPVPIESMYVISFVLLFATSLFSSVVIASVNFVIAAPEQQGIRFGLSQMWNQVLPLSLFLLMIQAVAMGAVAFFIIPIFIVSVYLLPTLWVYVTEERKGFDAFTRATSLVYGSFWRVVSLLVVLALYVFGIYLFMLALFAAGIFAGMYEIVSSTLLVGIGFLFVFALPFVMAWVFLFAVNYTFLLTQHLQIERPQGAYNPSEWGRAKQWYKIFLYVGILVTIIYYGFIAHTSVQEAKYGPATDEWSMEDEWYIRE